MANLVAQTVWASVVGPNSRPALQGHSSSLEPTWIDWPPMTSY